MQSFGVELNLILDFGEQLLGVYARAHLRVCLNRLACLARRRL